MKRRTVIFLRYFVPLLSLAVLLASGWLWHRSTRVADYFYRVKPNEVGSALRGFGSCRGVCLFGTVVDSLHREPSDEYQHDMLPLTTSTGGKSVLAIRPAYKAGGLGFGVSRGELAVNLPMAFLLPKRTYHVVYVPYYFIMLVALVPWFPIVRNVRRRLRRGSTSPSHADRSSRILSFPPAPPSARHSR